MTAIRLPPPASRLPPTTLPAFDIRPLTTPAELAACVALQRETWGSTFVDIVPPSILKITQRLGGIAAGAFDPDGRLIGFVFGITGIEKGRLVHWSDMLAVVPEARNLGVGRRLKEWQADRVRAMGVELMYWTYDPLVARNAHLNFNVLGVRVVEYVENMYGETDSVLHRGIGTDRFVVAWDLTAGRGARDAGRVRAGTQDIRRIEVPLDINELQRTDAEEAARWRERTRPEFQRAFAAGEAVVGFEVDEQAKRAYYLLSRAASHPDVIGGRDHASPVPRPASR